MPLYNQPVLTLIFGLFIGLIIHETREWFNRRRQKKAKLLDELKNILSKTNTLINLLTQEGIQLIETSWDCYAYSEYGSDTDKADLLPPLVQKRDTEVRIFRQQMGEYSKQLHNLLFISCNDPLLVAFVSNADRIDVAFFSIHVTFPDEDLTNRMDSLESIIASQVYEHLRRDLMIPVSKYIAEFNSQVINGTLKPKIKSEHILM